jgi:hypothetical protein
MSSDLLHSRLRKTVLKIDIEGAELLELKGASKFLGLKPVIEVGLPPFLRYSAGTMKSRAETQA